MQNWLEVLGKEQTGIIGAPKWRNRTQNIIPIINYNIIETMMMQHQNSDHLTHSFFLLPHPNIK